MPNLAPKPGQKVSYRDGGNVYHGEDSVATGTCNGEPVVYESKGGGGSTSYYPIWTDRDNGRESTTIMVWQGSILSVDDA